MVRAGLIACLGALACTAAPRQEVAPTPAVAQEVAPEERPPLPDTPLMRALRQAVAECELDGGYFEQCQGHVYFDEIGALEWEDLRAAVALEGRLLDEPEPELARLGLARLTWTLVSLKRGGRISEVADDALLARLRGRLADPGPLDRRELLRAYTAFSVGLGRDEEILRYLREHPDPEVRRVGYPGLWKFAGMRLWPELRGIVDGGDAGLATHVLSSIDIAELTEDEQRTVCEAFARWLVDPREGMGEQATSQIAYGCPRYHSAVLAEARRLLADQRLDRRMLAIGHLAEDCVSVGEETCLEAANLLTEIVRSTAAVADARDYALRTVWRADRSAGRRLAESMRRDPVLAEAAASVLAEDRVSGAAGP